MDLWLALNPSAICFRHWGWWVVWELAAFAAGYFLARWMWTKENGELRAALEWTKTRK